MVITWKPEKPIYLCIKSNLKKFNINFIGQITQQFVKLNKNISIFTNFQNDYISNM